MSPSLNIHQQVSETKERIDSLEIKVAFQERTIRELSDQVYTLHRELEILRVAIKTLQDRSSEDSQTRELLVTALQHPDHAEGTAAFLTVSLPL